MHSYTKGSPTAWQRKQLHRENNHRSSFHYRKLLVSKWTNIFLQHAENKWEEKTKTPKQPEWSKLNTEQEQAYIIHHLSHLQTLSHNKYNTRRTPNTPNNNIYSPPLFNRHMNFKFRISFPLAPNFKCIKAKTSFAFLVVLAKQHSWAWKPQIICYTEENSLHHLATGTNAETFLTVSIQNFNCYRH